MNNRSYKSIIHRLEKLEQDIDNLKVHTKETPLIKDEKFSGAAGGIRFLVARGFFKNKKNLSEVREELHKHGYPYSSQAINIALERLSKPKGLLIRLKTREGKIYAERK